MVNENSKGKFPGGIVAKNPELSLKQPGSLLWLGFDPWPRKFHMPQVQPKKKKKERKKKKKQNATSHMICLELAKPQKLKLGQFPRVGRWWDLKLIANRPGSYFGVMEIFWNQIILMVTQHCEYIKNHSTGHFKVAEFMLQKIYFNKKPLK